MNRNKLLLVFIIGLITMFSFNIDVFADAQELTCVYQYDDSIDTYTADNGTTISPKKVVLVQDSAGNQIPYTNSKDVALDDHSSYWVVNKLGSANFKLAKKLEKETLTDCPKHFIYDRYIDSTGITGGNFTITFTNECGKRDKCVSLNTSYKEVKTIVTNSGGMISDSSITTVGKKCSEISDPWLNVKLAEASKLSCLYGKDEGVGCHIIQLNVGGNVGIKVLSNYGTLDSKYAADPVRKGKLDRTEEDFAKLFLGLCPTTVKVHLGITKKVVYVGDGSYSEWNASYTPYPLLSGGIKGKNLLNDNDIDIDDYKNMIQLQKLDITSCDDVIDTNLSNILKDMLTLVKIIVPIILIVMGTIDLVQAVFAQDEAGIKKAQGRFIKRLIIAVVIFLLPTFVKVILMAAHSAWSWIDPNLCGILGS